MAKHPRRPAPKPAQTPRPAPARQSAIPAPQPPGAFQLPAFLANIRLQTLLIFAFAFLLYANTLHHGFVLDDAIVINQNVHTQKGISGISGILTTDAFTPFFKAEGKKNLVAGGRYRPFTLVIFAVTHQMVGENAFVFHLLTVLFFAATCALLFRTLRRLLSVKMGEGYAVLLAWLTAVLFAAHPIHTEVVANIKGCDEIVTLLLSLGALWLVLKAFDTGKKTLSWLAALVFFCACLSKENAATFTVIVPLALWFFRPAAKTGQIIALSAPLWAAFLAFFVIRVSVIGWTFGDAPMELMNNPFLKIDGNKWVAYSGGERLATIFYTLGKYVWLLIFPHPLTHDYYPNQIPLKTFSNPGAMLSLLLYLGLAAYALFGIGRKDPMRFGILFYLLTLSIVSNLVFPVGTSMGERFAFMPSVGFCLVAGALLLRLAQRGDLRSLTVPLALAGVLAFLFSVKTVLRNPAWASNEKLFFTDLPTSNNSAKIHNACGGVLFERAAAESDTARRRQIFTESLMHADTAIKIYPNYKDAFITRGGCHVNLSGAVKVEKVKEAHLLAAVADYRRALQLAENDAKIKSGLAIALRESGLFYGERAGKVFNNPAAGADSAAAARASADLASAIRFLNESWQLNPKDAATARMLGISAATQRKPAEALEWFKKAVELAPGNASFLFDLGTAYFNAGDPVKGAEFRKKAVDMDAKLGERK